jgi:hypothetical protein
VQHRSERRVPPADRGIRPCCQAAVVLLVVDLPDAVKVDRLPSKVHGRERRRAQRVTLLHLDGVIPSAP